MKTSRRELFLLTICTLFIYLAGNLFFTPKGFAFSMWKPSQQELQRQRERSHQTFWHQLSDSFRLNHYKDRPAVSAQIEWISHHQSYLRKILKNALPYVYYIHSETEKKHLPGELALLPIIESAYNPFAYSNRGAAGLWQLMPGTASGFGLRQNWWYDGRRDIYASTTAALDYFTYLSNFFSGNWLYTIAAYDAGEGTLQQAIEHNTKQGKNTSFWSLHLPKETHAYVPRLLALAAIISDPERYGVRLPPIDNSPYFAAVDVGTQIDLAHAAKLAGISLKTLYQLNPGFNRFATDPNGPHRLLLPVDSISTFKQNLAKLPVSKRVNWQRYHVQNGDSLNRIAHHYKTRVKLLQQVNKIDKTLIRPGEILLIPKNSKHLWGYNFNAEFNSSAKKYVKRGPKRVMLKIEKHDSLERIAKKHHLKVSQIEFWNHLKSPQDLQVGDQIILWIKSHRHGLKDRAKLRNYKIKSGDSIDRIARRFHVTTKRIKEINKLHSSLIKVGKILKIP